MTGSNEEPRARLAAAVHRIEGIRQGIGASEELADLYREEAAKFLHLNYNGLMAALAPAQEPAAAPEGWVERIAAVTSDPPPKLLCAQNLTFDYGWASAMERVRSMLAAQQPGAQHGQEGRPDV